MALTTDNKPLDSLYKAVSYQIKIDDETLDTSYEVNKMLTFKEVNKLGRARIYIIGGDYTKNTFDESESSIFDPGNEIEIKLGYDQKYTLVFQGVIFKHSISVKEGYQSNKARSQVGIECVDKAVMLKNSFTNTIYKEKTDSQIISNLVNQVSGLSSTIETTTYEHTVLPKYNVDDWSYILERAKYNGLLVLNSNNKISVKNPTISEVSPAVTLLNGAGTLSFEAHLNSINQFDSINLQSRDSFNDEDFMISDSKTITLDTSAKNLKEFEDSSKHITFVIKTNDYKYSSDLNKHYLYLKSEHTNGEKSGTWEYYFPNGELKKRENIKKRIITLYENNT